MSQGKVDVGSTTLHISLDILADSCHTCVTLIKSLMKRQSTMAKKHRDILNMQFDMLLKTKQYNELNPTNPNTRKASKEVCVNPRTGQKYIVVG